MKSERTRSFKDLDRTPAHLMEVGHEPTNLLTHDFILRGPLVYLNQSSAIRENINKTGNPRRLTSGHPRLKLYKDEPGL